ncbi:MAG TPA: phenylalanine--tRNA ligase beta subunit-related protein [Streptosporangiaceae bacterium]
MMHFEHSAEVWRDFPRLVAGILFADGITPDVQAGARAAAFTSVAAARLAAATESELAEIQAGTLPRLHPLVDLCNAISLDFAIPVAVFDMAKVTSHLQVRYADGDEDYLTFSGDLEHPAPGEMIFEDQAGRAHARRWSNRQGAYSAVGSATTGALIVAEALHDSAASDVPELMAAVASELNAAWAITPEVAVLTPSSPRFTVGQ